MKLTVLSLLLMTTSSHVLPVGYGGEPGFPLAFPGLHSSRKDLVPSALGRVKRDPNSAGGGGGGKGSFSRSIMEDELIYSVIYQPESDRGSNFTVPYSLATCTTEHLKCV